MITASLARHTGYPVPPPAVEAAMLHLGATASKVPRETVYSYATRNPRGPRRHYFTDTPGERVFIDEVTTASHALDDAIRQPCPAGTLRASSAPACSLLRSDRRSPRFV